MKRDHVMSRTPTIVLALTLTLTLIAHGGCSDRAPASAQDAGRSDAAADGASDAALSDTRRDGGAPLADLGPLPDVAPIVLPATKQVDRGRFATSPACARCHSNVAGTSAMRDDKQRPIAPHDLWQSTMMASAARDPFWRAVVSAEIAATPAAKGAIEAKCLTCHAPMAQAEASQAGKPSPGLATLQGESTGIDATAQQLGLDGVSCTVCHQILPDKLGGPSSFSGGFVIGDQRQTFGPHPNPFTTPMVNSSGFTPVLGKQLRESSLCASCHTLDTQTLDASGKATGHVLAEQSPYLEWRNSAFSTEAASPGPKAASCQSCHVPTTSVDGAPISTHIARRPNGGTFPATSPRSPFGRHVFVGGNTVVPRILAAQRAALNPQASQAAFDATVAAARELLSKRTAKLALSGLTRTASGLSFTVRVDNLAGHKMPTGFPSRRAWLRVRIKDASGATVFASGEVDVNGRILGPQGAPLPSELRGGPLQPHHLTVSDATQVQIYQSVMADPTGKPTYTLLRGATYAKDNRLLPEGYSATHPSAKTTAPVGTDNDGDFVGGSDQLRFELPSSGASGALQVEVALLYQPIGARFVAELAGHPTREVTLFLGYLSQLAPAPEVLATSSATLP